MKTPALILMVGVLALTSCIARFSGEADRKYKVSEKDFSFEQTFKTGPMSDLRISTSGGNIKTVGYNGDETTVSFMVTKYGKVIEITLEELRQIADVRIEQDSSHLDISVQNIRPHNISVGFVVKTPSQTESSLNTSGGDITMESLTANQTANTSGGDIFVRNITGDMEVGTSGGNINLDNATGRINASTSGGDINATAVKSQLTAHTSGGNINIVKAEGSVDVNTSGGNIKLDQIKGSIKAGTSGGDIVANIEKVSERLDMESSGGNIHCFMPQNLGLDLDLSADCINTPLTNFSGKAEKDKIQGKMNGGGIPVRLTTFGGEVELNYR